VRADLLPPAIRLDIPSLDLGGVPVLRDLVLDVPGGQVTCLLGASGSGKTTLLRLLAGLLAAPAGARITADDGAPLAPRVAWMAQQDLLLPWLDVTGNATLGARLRGQPPDLDRAARVLEQVGLTPHAGKMPRTLSGGQRQRAALARTLMEDRPVVLLDEPFSAVDLPTRLRLQDLAATLLAGRTVLLVTHDPLEALRLADRIVVLTGTPARAAAPIIPAGRAPRDPADTELLAEQARLLSVLKDAAP
jgi:putative hydroxymethylpyrimidine transport system ATP-binding protein